MVDSIVMVVVGAVLLGLGVAIAPDAPCAGQGRKGACKVFVAVVLVCIGATSLAVGGCLLGTHIAKMVTETKPVVESAK